MSAPYDPSARSAQEAQGTPMPPDYQGISGPRTWHTTRYGQVPHTGPLTSAREEIPFVDFPGIAVTSTGVHTPAGSIPLHQARFFLADRTWTTRSTPGWAIALAIGGFFVLTFFSLLFLLAKEERTTGYVDVTVTGAGVSYTSSVPVRDARTLAEIDSRWAYAQQLAGRA